MGVAKRPDGRWRARVETPQGQRARHFRTKAEATRWEAEQKLALHRGDFVDPAAGRTTFAEFYAEWAERQVWESNTHRAMCLAVRSVPFADLPLAKVRRSHVEAWVKAMVVADLAPSTIRTRFNNVRSVLRAAVRDRVISLDPSDGVTLPRQRRREAAMVLPTSEQVAALMEHADPEFHAYIALCAFAGLRLGEAAAVQVGDVDFLRKRLTVARQVQRAGAGAVELRPPKYGSERVVYLPAPLVELLAEHVKLHARSAWLFVGETDQPPHQNTVGHRWRQTCKRAGIEGMTLHDLRHYFASGLIASGCDVVTVQRALGHARATTTLNTYSHLWPTAEDRTRQAAAGLMAAALGQDRRDRSGTDERGAGR